MLADGVKGERRVEQKMVDIRVYLDKEMKVYQHNPSIPRETEGIVDLDPARYAYEHALRLWGKADNAHDFIEAVRMCHARMGMLVGGYDEAWRCEVANYYQIILAVVEAL